jgi:hypothetical protein
MEHKGMMERLESAHARHQDTVHGDMPWRAWGSWFSWGSPVGMGLGWTLFIIPLGIFLMLLKQIGWI